MIQFILLAVLGAVAGFLAYIENKVDKSKLKDK